MSEQNNIENNKRIAKNTLLLYFRMLFLMAISLFTSRAILEALGVSDYGIYNVVGGIVAMFTMLSGSLSNAISRFITFELGTGNKDRLARIFSTSVNIQVAISAIIVIIGEVIGIWFLNNKMNIPADRMFAANWVLQCSLGVFVCNLICVPYNAAIIAHERMNAFAYISILDASLKLVVVYMIYVFSYDYLIIYSLLLFGESVLIRLIYGIYSKRQFEECSYHFIHEKEIVKEMAGFAGWNYLGACAGILNTQGVNLLMNVFFGVTVNAARGVATQASNAIYQFVHSFTTAVNPQITKSYASGNLDYLYSLITRGAKFSAYMFMLMALPLALEAPTFFQIWLKEVPDFAIIFFRLSLLTILMDSVLVNSLMTAIFASGEIKKYQICVSLVGGSVFPLTWLAYYLGASAEMTYVIYTIVYCAVLVVRLSIVKEKVGLPIGLFIKDVLVKVIPVFILGSILPLLFTIYFEEGIERAIITTILSLISSVVLISTIGLNKGERNMLFSKVKSTIGKVRK